MCRLRAEAGESRLVVGIEAGVVTTAASTTAGEVTAAVATTATALTATTVAATGTIATGTIATSTITTATTAITAGTTAATAGSTGGGRALVLNPSLVDVEHILGLALTFTLGLTAGRSNEVLGVLLVESLGVGPLLVSLAALVGLADLKGIGKRSLLLELLSEVVGVRDSLGLGLGGSLGTLGVLDSSFLEFLLGDLLAGLLVLGLGITLVGAP